MMEYIVPSDPDCLFCKIVAGKIPSKLVYQDDEIYVFHDIHPWAPVHFLMIPKQHIPSMAQVGPEQAGLIGRMMALVPKLALQEGCNPYPDGGFRILSNTGDEGRQEVHHLHIHVMGGPRPWLKG
jgi:histidine triad (HIT) family protein